MKKIDKKVFSSDKTPIVGFCIVAHNDITKENPATVGDDLGNTLEVPMQFFVGDLKATRHHIHWLIDDLFNKLDAG